MRFERAGVLLGAMLLGAALAGVATASIDDDFAWQWPLALPDDDSGAYRVFLDASVYRAMQSRRLDDLDVANATGDTVPAALLPAQSVASRSGERIPLPWFPLPSSTRRGADDIALQVERDADGSVRRVEARVAAARMSEARDAEAAQAASWLVDASRIERRIVALWLEWEPPASPLDVSYRVDGSDDLRVWRVLQAQSPLVDLARDGDRLQQRRIPVDGQARYLRLSPAGGSGGLQLSAVHAELAPVAMDTAWYWQDIEGRAVEDRGTTHYVFELDGRFPVARADLVLPGNQAGEWTLHSRDDASQPWVRRAGPWVFFRVGGDGSGEQSAPQALTATVRDRHWRLTGSARPPQPPTLRLGWQPETVVFIAQGPPPYRLLAGSAEAVRAGAPVAQLLDAIRRQRGHDWQPAAATLGTAAELAGARALQPKAPPRDWTSWLLWSLLVAGALLVAAFAISLLRARQGD